MGGTVGVGGWHPAVAMDIIVVTACVSVAVFHSRVGVVGRNPPDERGHPHIHPEAQVLRRVVHPSSAVQPYTMQVDRHVDFVARVGIESVEPYLIVRRVHPLHPDVVYEHVGLYLVVIPAVNHQLPLAVQVVHCATGLAVGKVVDGPSRSSQAHQDHDYYDCNSFHKALGF